MSVADSSSITVGSSATPDSNFKFLIDDLVCYDQLDTTTVDHPEVLVQDATYDAEGVELTPAIAYKAAWTETTRTAGDRYSFRMDELNLFIARGFEARLAALEAA